MTAKVDADEAFMKTLEEGVRAVLSDKKAKPHERVAAISAGAKLLAIKHKIKDDESESFFK
jgi:hypothetical protein